MSGYDDDDVLDVEEGTLLKKILVKLKADSLVDVGCGVNTTALLVSIGLGLKTVACVDPNTAGLWYRWNDLSQSPRVVECNASLFDVAALHEAMKGERERFPFAVCYAHKTLHHLRRRDCKFMRGGLYGLVRCPRDSRRRCVPQKCRDAIGTFDALAVFEALFRCGRTVVVSEHYYAGVDQDRDDEDGDGGLLDLKELHDMVVTLLSSGRTIKFYRPFVSRRPMTISRHYNATRRASLEQVDHAVFVVSNR